ncbi:MAG: hypothetical protein KatS3mg076_0097 [Candidatus Binatia bacterium]|nr:MAG: hypothetical protein KatS3mg076_0097 [Candidatus Binatia bacterium]
MNVRRRVHLAMLVGFPLGVFLFLAGFLLHRIFLGLGVVFQLSLLGYLLTRKCRVCNKAVLNNPVTCLGTKSFELTFCVPRRCTLCGASLEDQR